MCEALIGAVAFHTTTIQALRVAGFIIGIGKNEMQVLIQGHKMGYVPYCVSKQLDENDPILTTQEALERVSILEGIQQLFPRFSFPVDTITVLSPWRTCPSTPSCRENPTTIIRSNSVISMIVQILEFLGDAVIEWLVMDLIVDMDRNHVVSRNVNVMNCEHGTIPLCPFTVSSRGCVEV